MENEILEEKLTSLLKHITKQDDEIQVLNEVLSSTLLKLEKCSHLEHLVHALTIPNPKLAIKMLRKNKIDSYMYACKSLESKIDLFREALWSDDTDVIVAVSAYLNFSLNQELFGKIVMNNPKASSFYLNYLLEKDYKEFELICLRYNKTNHYIKIRLQRALAIPDYNKRKSALESCLELCDQEENLKRTIINCLDNMRF